MLSDTQRWGCMCRVNQITVSSLILCHTWMFPTSHSCLPSLIIDATQQLAASFSAAAIGPWRGTQRSEHGEDRGGGRSNCEQCGHVQQAPHESGKMLDAKFMFLFSLFPTLLVLILLFVSSRHPSPESFPCQSLARLGREQRAVCRDCQAFS